MVPRRCLPVVVDGDNGSDGVDDDVVVDVVDNTVVMIDLTIAVLISHCR